MDCIHTELEQTLRRSVESCAPAAGFILADVRTVEWADKTAEYWFPLPFVLLYCSPLSFFIFNLEVQVWGVLSTRCFFLFAVFVFLHLFLFFEICPQSTATAWHLISILLLQQQPNLWSSSVTDLKLIWRCVVLYGCSSKRLIVNCAPVFFCCRHCVSPIRTYMVQKQAQEQELFPPVKWVCVQ